jgi:hypothetical protein
MDPHQSLRIEADDNILDRVSSAVHGGILEVGLTDGSYNHVTVNIYASMSAIERLESIGAADFTTPNSIQTDMITCRITGTGTMLLKGTASKVIVELAGAGTVRCFELTSSQCTVTLTGTGNVEVNATQLNNTRLL